MKEELVDFTHAKVGDMLVYTNSDNGEVDTEIILDIDFDEEELIVYETDTNEVTQWEFDVYDSEEWKLYKCK